MTATTTLEDTTFSITRAVDVTLANMTSNLEYIAPVTWISTETYPLGYLVNYSGVIYRSKVINTNFQPNTNPSYWDVVSTGTQMYASGTAYAIGDRVFALNSDVVDVYESLTAANTGNTPASSPTHWALRQTIYREWAPAIPLAIGAIVTWDKKLYEHLVTGADATTPDLAPDNWLDKGPATVWAPFDDQTGTQASRGGEIVYTFTLTGRYDTLCFINVAAENINIKVNGGTDYDEDYNLIALDTITDYWSYFFEEITANDRLFVDDIPSVLNPTITITLTGDQVALGLLVLGRRRELGYTRDDADIGIDDLSLKISDNFGGFTFVKRGYNDQGNFTVHVPSGWVDGVKRVLTSLRATPTLYIGTKQFTSTWYYGICNWRVTFSDDPDYVALKLEITGL